MSCILVVGCYRSGTSAVAGVLHHLGVAMGEEFDPPARSNPKGYFEDLGFKRLFDAAVGGENVDGLLDVAVRGRELRHPLWGVKDPQLCLLAPNVVGVLERNRFAHKVVATDRDKEAICASLAKAVVGQPAERFLTLVDYYLSRRDQFLRDYAGPVLHVDFEELKADKGRVIRQVADFAGLAVNEAALSFVGS